MSSVHLSSLEEESEFSGEELRFGCMDVISETFPLNREFSGFWVCRGARRVPLGEGGRK